MGYNDDKKSMTDVQELTINIKKETSTPLEP